MKALQRRSPLLAVLALAAALLTLHPAACAPAAPTGASSPAPAAQASPVTIAEEIELGNKVAAEVRKKYGGSWNNPQQAERIRVIAFKLFEVSDRHQDAKLRANFTVELLDTKMINAFCVPGGHTFVTRGLVELGLNDDELAGVMGHEIAHASRRHGARNLEANHFLQARVNRITKRKTLQTLAQIPILVYLFKRFSPQLEHEADYYGAIYATRAGYDPQGLVTLLQRFAKLEGGQSGSRLKRFLSSLGDNHPATPERIKRTAELAGKLKRGENVPTTEVPIYN